MDNSEVGTRGLGIEPLAGAVGGSVVDNDDVGEALLGPQGGYTLLEQFKTVVSDDDSCNFHFR